MCDICDGMTMDEYLERTCALVDEHGFTVQGVDVDPPWAYTIGLASHDHPELVITGLGWPAAGMLIERLGQRVLLGERFDVPAGAAAVGAVAVRFGAVHPAEWDGRRFAMWVNYYEAIGALDRTPRQALQVLWPDEHGAYPDQYCEEHGAWQPLLCCDPNERSHRANRAERRAAGRAARRRGPRNR